MARDNPPQIVHVFLSSPGDVPEERAAARDLLKAELPYDPLLRGKVMFDVTSWDDPAAPAPLLPTQTPQSAVNRFLRRPGQCHIVITILAGRIGTPLDPSVHLRPDGSAYRSGTIWEFEDALNATPRPDILLYRRADAPDPEVEAFFAKFRNPDGSLCGLWTDYTTPSEFARLLTTHVKYLLRERLDAAAEAGRLGPAPAAAVTTPPAASPLPSAAAPGLATPLLPPDRCLGRDTEIAELVATLTTPRPGAVVVMGGPGMGKTTLTRAVATHPDVAARFAERRWFVPLETANDAASLRTAVVAALGGNPADPAAFDQALGTLAAAPALLVLDNLETPYDADTAPTRDTLRRLVAVPSLTLLCSYRGAAAPAAPAFPHQPVVPPLPPDAARDLFLQLAPRIRVDDLHLAPFLRELGGVPLAIELLALHAAPHEALAELWEEWQRRGVELAQDPDLPEGRLTSLVRSIDLSWQSSRLHEQGRRLFRLLGALPAGMAREDRAALQGDDATEAARQVLAIGLAVSAEGRLDLLPPVRAWARRRQQIEAETNHWCRHYLALLIALGPRIGATGGAEAVTRLTPEVANLEAAFAAASGDRRPVAVDAAYGLCGLLRFTGLGRTAPLEALAQACRVAHDLRGEANCIKGLGDIALARSRHEAARAAYEQALPLFRQVGAVPGEADCIQSLGDIALRHSQHDAARAAYERALPLYRQVGAVLGEANCIQSLGDIARLRSQHDAARAAYEQALQLYRQVGAVLGEAVCTARLGQIALVRSQHDAARAAYEQALSLFCQVGDALGEANCIKRLGDIALALSDHDAAREAYEQALPLYRQVGDGRGEANCILSLGDIALARSQHDVARVAYEQALPLYRQIGDVLGEANCFQSLGDIAREQGDVVTARGKYEAALALFARIPEPFSVGWTLFRLAALAEGAERAAHVAAAREAWTSIDRPDLVAELGQFG
jgi:tetratricopeptide (TPR) repeat protein